MTQEVYVLWNLLRQMENLENSSCRNRRAGILYVPLLKRAATSENKQVSCEKEKTNIFKYKHV